MRRDLDQTVFLAPETMASLAATALVRDLCAEMRGLGGALTTGEKARSTLRLTTLSALSAAEARSASLTWSRRAVSRTHLGLERRRDLELLVDPVGSMGWQQAACVAVDAAHGVG